MSAYPSPNNMSNIIAGYNSLKQKIENNEANAVRNPKPVRFHFMELKNGEVGEHTVIPMLAYEARDKEDEPWRHFVSECCGSNLPLVDWIVYQEHRLFGLSGVIDFTNSGDINEMMNEAGINTDWKNVLIITKDTQVCVRPTKY